MSWYNKVVWSEGMFLRPAHFQQHNRYVENLVDARCRAVSSHGWGFVELKLDRNLSALGKIAISEARGLFPDGTPFEIPASDDAPVPLDVPTGTRDTIVYLALPVRRAGMDEIGDAAQSEGLERFLRSETEVRDSNLGSTTVADVQIAKLNSRLMLEQDRYEEFACIGVAQIVEVREDGNVILEDAYLPTTVDCRSVTGLQGYVREIQGLLHHRGDALAGRISEAGRGGSAEIADYLMLQLVNRYEPVIAHLATGSGLLHPETLYRFAVELAGELATFTAQNKRPTEFPPYRHEDLRATFEPVMAELRRSLSMVLEQNAVPLPLEERAYGIRVAGIPDRGLLSTASFVLAVAGDISTEEIRQRFPAQVKIGPVEQIRQLVNVQLPGIAVRALPVAPRQLPYQSGFVYFELDRSSEFWAKLDSSGGFAIHLSGEFPGIRMEFWAIRG